MNIIRLKSPQLKPGFLIKPGLNISRKDRKHLFTNMFFKLSSWLGLHIVAMITSIDISQEIFAVDILKALKSYLKHHRKHALRLLQLYTGKDLRFPIYVYKTFP